MTDRRRRRRVSSRRGDAGATLIEMVVAIALLTVVVTATVVVIISTGGATQNDRIRNEAVNLATEQIDQIENKAAFSPLSSGTVGPVSMTVSENGSNSSGIVTKQTFSVTTVTEDRRDSGGSVCSTSAGIAPEIWVVQVSVGWRGDGTPVTQTTYVAPDQGGVVPATAGELAVPIDTVSGTPYTQPVPVVVQGTWEGGGTAPASPAGDVTYATGDSGSSGCVVFQDLDPTAGWVYTVYLGTGNGSGVAPSNQAVAVTQTDVPGIVNGGVTTSSPSSTSPPQSTAPSLILGSDVLASPFYVSPASPAVSVQYQTYTCPTPYNVTTCVTSTAPPISPLPVTVSTSPSELTTPFSFDTSSAPQAISSISLWPYVDYTAWAGDWSDSSPTYATCGTCAQVYTGDAGVSINAAASPLPSVTLPVYLLKLSDSTLPVGVTLSATTIHGQTYTYALSAFTANTSLTGLPPGEYSLSASGGHTVTSPKYIWVTPTGVYPLAAILTAPTGTIVPAGTAVPVVVA